MKLLKNDLNWILLIIVQYCTVNTSADNNYYCTSSSKWLWPQLHNNLKNKNSWDQNSYLKKFKKKNKRWIVYISRSFLLVCQFNWSLIVTQVNLLKTIVFTLTGTCPVGLYMDVSSSSSRVTGWYFWFNFWLWY